MRQLIIAIFSIFFTATALGQDFSNKGKEFWIPYSYHVGMSPYTANNPVVMTLYITSDVTTTYDVEIYGGAMIQSGTINAGQVVTCIVPVTAFLDNEGTFINKSVRVTAKNPVVVYSYITQSAVSGATLCLPTNVLGREYISLNFTQVSNAPNSNSYFTIIAVEDNTQVEIIPTANTKNGWIAGNKYPITLQKGEIYQVLGANNNTAQQGLYYGNDLTGSSIKSVATPTSPCKKIAVFSGAGKIRIGANCGNNSSSDNLYQQLYPLSTWGKSFLTVPSFSKPLNYYRIIRTKSTSIIKLNGLVIPSTSFVNGYYEFSGNIPNKIESDEPISVSQYFTTQGCDGNSNPLDPDMIILNPIEQNLSKVTLVSSNLVATANRQHHLQIIMPNSGTGISSFKLDGNAVPSNSWTVHPGNPLYSYVYLSNVTQGYHTLNSDSGFNALAYGYAAAESYGYSAGSNVKDLYQTLSTSNKFAKVKLPATCKGTPFNISITLPYEPLSLEWKVPTYAAIPKDNAPQKDSSRLVNGKTVYYYSLKGSYVYDTIKTYSIQVIANNPTTDGCTGEQQIDFDLQVFEPPKAGFELKSTNCTSDSLLFSDTTTVVGRPIVGYFWDFGDGTIDSVKTVKHKYASQGNYTVKYFAYTDVGCVSETVTKEVKLDDKPTAKFTISGKTCQNKEFIFLNESWAAPGTGVVKWYWNFGNADPQLINTSGVGVLVKYPALQQYTPSLVVETFNGCKSEEKKLTFTNYPNPTVDFSVSKICLPDGIGQFTDLSSIADGSESTFLRKWNFGDLFATTANPDNVVNQASPKHFYQTTGPYNVKLVVESNKGCIDSIVKPLTQIYAQPKTDFNVTAEVCLRENTKFTDLTNAQTRTVTSWNWTFSDGTTSSLRDPSILIGGPGTYTAKLFSFTSDGCVSDTVTKSFTVHPLPTPDFTISSPVCETQSVGFNQTAIANVGNITRWNWTLGNGATPVDFNNSSATVAQTFASWGDQTIKLMVENSKGCKSDTLKRIYRIHPKPVVNYSLPEVCLSDAFAFFVSDIKIADNSTGFSYLWNFGDPNANATYPNTGTGASISHKYTAARDYTMNLQVTSAAGCISNLTQTFTVNGATPKAGFSIIDESALCSNKEVSIQNLSEVDFGTVSKLEIYWDFLNSPNSFITDENPSLNKTYKYLYANFQNQPTKTITIRVRAYSGGTCADDELRTITLKGSPLVSFEPLPGICLEAIPRQITQATYVDVSGIPKGVELYTGTAVNAIGVYDPSISGAGIFPIKYTFTSSNACSIFTSQDMLVWPRPTADFSISALQCEKNPITFTNKSIANAGNIVTWNWNFGDGTPLQPKLNGNDVPYTYAVFKPYNATLDVVTNNGCTSVPKTMSIIVNPLPIVNFDLPKVCLPIGKALFTNKTTIPDATSMTYLWNFGDINDQTAAVTIDGNHNFKNLQSYDVKLVATSNNNCKDSLTRTLVDVFPQPKASFTSADSACIGTPIPFKNTSDGLVRPITQWNWDFNNGTTDVSKDPNYLFRTTGTFNISMYVISSEGCISDTATKAITVFPYPKISAGPDMFVLDDGQKTINATASGNGLTYFWDPAIYLNERYVLQPKVVFPQQDGIYTLAVTGRGGCTSFDDMLVTVLKLPKPPNTFTPNNDGFNDRWEVKYLDQYPGCIIEVFNTQGLLVYRSIGYGTAWDGTYKGNPLPSGTYYYVIDPKSGRSKIAGYVTIIK